MCSARVFVASFSHKCVLFCVRLELSQATNVSSDAQMEDSKPHSECIVDGAQQQMSEAVAQVKDGVEESEEGESDEECVMATSPQMAGASVIKYSVKTTPYLQR